MSTATIEIYRTESGSVHEIVGRQIRRVTGDGTGPVEEWTEYVAINRIPATLFRAGTPGEVLESCWAAAAACSPRASSSRAWTSDLGASVGV